MTTKKKEEPKAKPVEIKQTAPVPMADLIPRLRAAPSIEDAVSILAPTVTARPKADAVYKVNTACTDPLPQRRGACLKVYAVAVRLDRPFTAADIATALPEVKAAPYWTRKLAKTGHLVGVAR